MFAKEKLTPRDLFARLVSFKSSASSDAWCSNWDIILGQNKLDKDLEHVFLKCKLCGQTKEPNNPYAITKSHIKPDSLGGCEGSKKPGTASRAAQHDVITLDEDYKQPAASKASSSKRELVQSNLDRFNPAPAVKAQVIEDLVGFFLESFIAMRSMYATSCAPERNWSKWGLLYTKLRANLSLETGEKIIFVNGNRDKSFMEDDDEEISLDTL